LIAAFRRADKSAFDVAPTSWSTTLPSWKMRKAGNLQNLKLYCVPEVTDAGLKHLARCKSLRELDVYAIDATVAGFTQLREARPDMTIVAPQFSPR